MPPGVHHQKIMNVGGTIRRRVARFAPEKRSVNLELPAPHIFLPHPRPHAPPHAEEPNGPTAKLRRRLGQKHKNSKPQLRRSWRRLKGIRDGHEALQQRVRQERQRPRIEVVPSEP
eukprot:694942-Pyramimonas_sp.AAC.1